MKLKSGYTLIELIVVAGLIGLMSLGLVNMFTSSVRGSQRARLQAEIKSQGDFALASMERQIRNASELPKYDADTNKLTFNVPGTEEVQTYTVGDANIVFNNGTLFSAPVQASDITFGLKPADGLSPGAVEIKFTLAATSGNLTVTQAFQSTVAMRNIK